jgi:type IV pilus assembly protein PilB
MERSEKMLAEQLLEAKVLGSAKLDAALSARTGGRFLADRLVNQHDADEVAIAETLAMWQGWPFIDPALHTDDAGAQQSVPLSVWQQYGLIPIDRCGDFLTVATSNYLADDVVRALELASGCRVRPLVATVASIRRILDTVPEADSEPLRARND